MDSQISTHRTHRSIKWLQLVVIFLVLSFAATAILLQHQHAYGATIVVDTFADDITVNGNCTLREAVISANADSGADNCITGSGADTISLPSGLFVLSLGQIDLGSEMEIVGQGMDQTVIDGSLSTRIFSHTSGPATAVTIRNLTLKNARPPLGFGGGALYQGQFNEATLENVRLNNNATDRYGGAIYSQGTLTLIDCDVTNNFATGDPSFNSGGAIRSTGELTIIRTTFWNNGLDPSASPGQGGAIYQDLDLLTIEDSTFRSNEAANGGAIHALGEVHITGTTFYENDATSAGGAINSGPSGNLYITNSTFSENDGGDLRYSGDAWIQNSTFFDYYLTDVTLTSGGGTLTIKNSILFSNYGANCSVPILSAGYNLANDTSCSLSGTGDLSGVDPKLDFWADNGGLTRTHALKPGSPAIDAGNPAGCTDDVGSPILTDQRGFPRPMDGNVDGTAVCDMGAYEAEPEMIYLPLIMR
jgi:CSLREA domain-containing protein